MAESTGIIPQGLRNKPKDLGPHLQFYLSLYREVERERPFTGDGKPRPLRFVDFLTFAQFHEFTREDTNRCWKFVRVVDDAWLRDYRKRQQAHDEKLKARAKSR